MTLSLTGLYENKIVIYIVAFFGGEVDNLRIFSNLTIMFVGITLPSDKRRVGNDISYTLVSYVDCLGYSAFIPMGFSLQGKDNNSSIQKIIQDNVSKYQLFLAEIPMI